MSCRSTTCHRGSVEWSNQTLEGKSTGQSNSTACKISRGDRRRECMGRYLHLQGMDEVRFFGIILSILATVCFSNVAYLHCSDNFYTSNLSSNHFIRLQNHTHAPSS